MSPDDPWQLQRFVDAQAPVYAQVDAELAAGRKQSHWMWFVFPQLQGLGQSAMAQRYGIRGADEARAYWRHPLLGARLEHCASQVLAHSDRSARAIFGSPDDMKLRSSMTLFSWVAPEAGILRAVLARFFPEGPDELTMQLLGQEP